MKIRLLSDLHRERGPFTYVDEGEDVVVLAGDVDNGVAGIEWAKTIPKPVVMIAGNHDHWGCDLIDNVENMRTAAAGSNVHFLECDEAIITVGDESIRFLGTTLWTDYAEAYLVKHGQYIEADRQAQMMYFAHKSMNDFLQITYENKPLSAKILLEMHRKSRAWLNSKIKDQFDGRTIVVTHHAPSYQSLIHANDLIAEDLDHVIKGNRRPDYRSERVASYASDVEDLAAHVDFWMHGHVHSPIQYNLNKCLVVCNPRGYIRGPAKSSIWWPMSPKAEDESLAKFNEHPERGDVSGFDKAFIIDMKSTMPVFMLARAKGKIVEINAVIKVMAAHVKYTKNDDANIAAMGINKVHATIAKYNLLINETMALIAYSTDRQVYGDADNLQFRLGWHDIKGSLLARNMLEGMEMTVDHQHYFKDAAENAKRALVTMRNAIKVIKSKLEVGQTVEIRNAITPESK